MADAEGVMRAQGAVLGALVGDSVGSYLEFVGKVKPASLDKAMSMPGGGHHGVSPGQVTDDGEMTLCLLRALCRTQGHYDADAVAQSYKKWAASKPFDMGRTTYAALGGRLSSASPAADVAKRAAVNVRSLANGHMMRCTPLGVFGWRLPAGELVKVVRADAALTHPADAVHLSSLVYVATIGRLIAGDDADAAITAARDLVAVKAAKNAAAATVLQWLDEGLAGILPAFHPKSGFVRIAFSYAFFHLKRRTPYLDALRATLAGGGDTDTNACIVGGLLGAAYGIDGIPDAWVAKVLACDTEGTLTRRRPEWLRPTERVLDEVAALYHCAPTSLSLP
eukprot:TRINITY_DN12824_c0_g1_i1.p1 TRINITY_DN12824_c0_g1~~TRINITY_DN12824_c0_g1_i1.p1  ORF type:complete len:337 (+),score=49.87 TRINITY_DN12824_c0_g1_i1:130-1140(+)